MQLLTDLLEQLVDILSWDPPFQDLSGESDLSWASSKKKLARQGYTTLQQFQNFFDALCHFHLSKYPSKSKEYTAILDYWKYCTRIIQQQYEHLPIKNRVHESDREHVVPKPWQSCSAFMLKISEQNYAFSSSTSESALNIPGVDLQKIEVHPTVTMDQDLDYSSSHFPSSANTLGSLIPFNARPIDSNWHESCVPMHFIDYGPFATFAPSSDSTKSTLSVTLTNLLSKSIAQLRFNKRSRKVSEKENEDEELSERDLTFPKRKLQKFNHSLPSSTFLSNHDVSLNDMDPSHLSVEKSDPTTNSFLKNTHVATSHSSHHEPSDGLIMSIKNGQTQKDILLNAGSSPLLDSVMRSDSSKASSTLTSTPEAFGDSTSSSTLHLTSSSALTVHCPSPTLNDSLGTAEPNKTYLLNENILLLSELLHLQQRRFDSCKPDILSPQESMLALQLTSNLKHLLNACTRGLTSFFSKDQLTEFRLRLTQSIKSPIYRGTLSLSRPFAYPNTHALAPAEKSAGRASSPPLSMPPGTGWTPTSFRHPSYPLNPRMRRALTNVATVASKMAPSDASSLFMNTPFGPTSASTTATTTTTTASSSSSSSLSTPSAHPSVPSPSTAANSVSNALNASCVSKLPANRPMPSPSVSTSSTSTTTSSLTGTSHPHPQFTSTPSVSFHMDPYAIPPPPPLPLPPPHPLINHAVHPAPLSTKSSVPSSSASFENLKPPRHDTDGRPLPSKKETTGEDDDGGGGSGRHHAPEVQSNSHGPEVNSSTFMLPGSSNSLVQLTNGVVSSTSKTSSSSFPNTHVSSSNPPITTTAPMHPSSGSMNANSQSTLPTTGPTHAPSITSPTSKPRAFPTNTASGSTETSSSMLTNAHSMVHPHPSSTSTSTHFYSPSPTLHPGSPLTMRPSTPSSSSITYPLTTTTSPYIHPPLM
ncbi:hypothetical protein HMI56_002218, partial [Coelomomyces lativittatus]